MAKSVAVDTRNYTLEQRRELFLKARKAEKPDFQVLTTDYEDNLVPYGLITFDSVLGLNGIKRHGFVSQVHGDEGVGKCLVANTIMASPAGLFYVGEIFEQSELPPVCTTRVTEKTYSLLNRNGVEERTSHFTHNGKRPVFSIKTKSGNELKNTAHHQHLILNHAGYWVWRRTEELLPGDYLVGVRNCAIEGNRTSDTNEELYFVGSAVADAWFGNQEVSITNDDPKVLAVAASVGSQVMDANRWTYKPDDRVSVRYTFRDMGGTEAFYEKYGFLPGVAKDKHVGRYLRALCPEQMKYFLQGYFDCECSIDAHGIEVSSASHKLLMEVKLILQMHFGIISVLHEKTVKAYPDNDYWRLQIFGEEAEKFNARIGFGSDVRKEQFKRLFATSKVRNTNIDVIPNCGVLLEALYDSSETSEAHNAAVRDYKGSMPYANPSYKKLGTILSLPWANSPVLQRLQDIRDAGYFYDEVAEIAPAGEEPTFDFTLPQTHSFIASGVVSHNSTLTYQIAANYQQETGESLGVFDFEGTGTPDYMEKIGCDMDMVKFIQPDSMEDSVIETLDLILQGCRFFIYDSIPWIKAEIDEKDIRSKKAFKASYGKHAQDMGKFFTALLPRIRRADGHIMMVNQTRSRIDDSLDAKYANDYSYTNKTYVLPGGRICRFTPATMIEMRMDRAVNPYDGKAGQGPHKDPFIVEPATKDTEGKPCVNRVRVRTLKNKVTGAGFREGFIWVRPATSPTPGIDNLMSIRELAREHGFIANKGAKWYVGKSAEEAFVTYPNKDAAIEDLVVNRNPAIHKKLEIILKDAIAADTTGRYTSTVTKEEIDMIEGDGAVPVGEGFVVEEEV